MDIQSRMGHKLLRLILKEQLFFQLIALHGSEQMKAASHHHRHRHHHDPKEKTEYSGVSDFDATLYKPF